MVTLANAGRSASEIAVLLSGELSRKVTRNAVIGKMTRMGYTKRAGRNDTSKIKPARRSPAAPAKRRASSRQPASAPVAPIQQPDLSARPVTFDELQRHHCRWPLGDPGTPDFRFCGDRRAAGQPYCDEHRRTAWRPA